MKLLTQALLAVSVIATTFHLMVIDQELGLLKEKIEQLEATLDRS